MVNVPGRSNGCLTCRARKVKCDAKLPYCDRCSRNGHQCRGYARPRIFVNHTIMTGSQTVPPHAIATRKWKIYVGPTLNGRSKTIQDTRILAAPDPRPPQRGQLLAHFINSFCPDCVQILDEAARPHHYWVQLLPGLHGTSAVLDTAMSTLAAAYLGQMRDDHQLQTQSLLLYGEAVKRLSWAMTAPAFIADDYTLASIMCLGMSEMYSQPIGHEHGWFSHNKGGCELIKSRGPSILETELGRSLFIRFRVTGIWRDLTLGASKAFHSGNEEVDVAHASAGSKWSFALADPGMSRLSQNANQSYYDLLIETMIPIPALLQDIRALSTQHVSQPYKTARAKALIERAVTIAESLLSWHATTECLQVYQADISTVISPTNSANTLPAPVIFPNLMVAQALTHYWAAMVVVLRCIMICHEKLSALSSQALPSTKAWLFSHLGVEMDPQTIAGQFADAICSSVEYCIAADKGTAGSILLLHPLSIAKDLYATEADALAKPKRAFCIAILKKLMARGLRFSQALIQLSGQDDLTESEGALEDDYRVMPR